MNEPRCIPLRNRATDIVAFAIVDAEDYEWLSGWRWHLNDKGYAKRSERVDGESRLTLMHRQILGLDHGDERCGDHVNRNRLDNRRANLRILPNRGSNFENSGSREGSSRFRGVSWNRAKGRWAARAGLNGRDHHLGYFDSEEEAAAVASAFRREHMPFAVEGATA